MSRRREDTEPQVRMHYLGYSKNMDEWIDVTSERLAAPGTHALATAGPVLPHKKGHVKGAWWRVEKLIKKRRVKKKLQYKCKWEGWGDDHNSWEPASGIDKVLKEEFEAAAAAAAAAAAKPAAPPR
eukprot:697908-Prymnesium_polylepis.1